METLTLINGNRQPYTLNLPRVVIQTDSINDVALQHVFENTGLRFKRGLWNSYDAQPESALQITALLMTYNFKTRYYNNWEEKNTLFLRFDHHVGFDVTSICYECAQHNHIHTGDMDNASRLSC